MASRRIFRGVLAAGRVSMRANGSFSAPCRCRSYDVVLRSSLTESNRESVNTWQLIPSVLFCNFSQLKSEHNPSAGQSAGSGIALDEARKLLRLVNVEALKRKLESEGQDFISFSELSRICKSMGITHSDQDAEDFAKALDAAGVILIFRNKVYLHPDKVAELVINAMPLALAEEDDPKRQELLRMQKEKQEIDRIAHKQVRLVLWCGLGFFFPADSSLFSPDILGALLGCNGACNILCYNRGFACWVYVLSYYIERSYLSGSDEEAFSFQAEEAVQKEKFQCG